MPDSPLSLKENRKKFKVLFLSEPSTIKRCVAEFLKIPREVKKLRNNIEFIMAGPTRTPGFSDTLKKFIHENQLNKIIRMPGAVYGIEKEKIFNESDIFIHPTFNDAFHLLFLKRSAPVCQ